MKKKKSAFEEQVEKDVNRVTNYKPFYSNIDPFELKNRYNIGSSKSINGKTFTATLHIG